MADQTNSVEAQRAFDAALEALANKLIVSDKAWNFAFKTAQIHFDRTAYQSDTPALTIMLAEAELNRQIKRYNDEYRNKNPAAGQVLFLQEGPSEFLEIRSAVLKLAAVAQQVPGSHRTIVDDLSLPRFVENIEYVTKCSYMFHTGDAAYEGMNLPRSPA